LRLDLRKQLTKTELLSIGEKTSFNFCTFTHLNDFAFNNSVKKRRKKKTMKAQRLTSRVRENADLLKLLFCDLLKQVNIAIEAKTIGAIFSLFLFQRI